MSAPVTERGRTAVRGRTAAIPAQRGVAGAAASVTAPAKPAVEPPSTARRSAAAGKAYARRDERMRRAAGARTATTAGRPQFVLLIMVLLVVGLVATLWLSTAAAADSYRLQDATAEARVLSEQAERLKQEVAVLASAPELARRAGELGMVPVRAPARLVVAPDGSVSVVGEPRAAVPPPPPPPPPGDGQPGDGQPEEAVEGEQPGRATPPGEEEAATDPETTAGGDTAGEDADASEGTEQLAAPAEQAAQPEPDGGEPAPEGEGQDAGAGPAGAGAGDGTDAG